MGKTCEKKDLIENRKKNTSKRGSSRLLVTKGRVYRGEFKESIKKGE